MKEFSPGSKVEWRWLGRPIRGEVKEVYPERVTRVIKGKSITRNGTSENPAYLVVSEAGNEALKLQTELSMDESSKADRSTPTMFR